MASASTLYPFMYADAQEPSAPPLQQTATHEFPHLQTNGGTVEKFRGGTLSVHSTKCSVCRELLQSGSAKQQQSIVVAACGHGYHLKCAGKALEQHPNLCHNCYSKVAAKRKVASMKKTAPPISPQQLMIKAEDMSKLELAGTFGVNDTEQMEALSNKEDDLDEELGGSTNLTLSQRRAIAGNRALNIFKPVTITKDMLSNRPDGSDDIDLDALIAMGVSVNAMYKEIGLVDWQDLLDIGLRRDNLFELAPLGYVGWLYNASMEIIRGSLEITLRDLIYSMELDASTLKSLHATVPYMAKERKENRLSFDDLVVLAERIPLREWIQDLDLKKGRLAALGITTITQLELMKWSGAMALSQLQIDATELGSFHLALNEIAKGHQ